MSQSKGSSVAGRIMSVKSSSNTTGNQVLDLPDCSVLPHLIVPLLASWIT